MIKILLCCSAGASTSILVKSMRMVAEERNIECAIAATSESQVAQYISKVDVVLVAPQLIYDVDRIEKMALPYKTKVFMIGREDYGKMNAKNILLNTINKIELLNLEEQKMDKLSLFLEKYMLPIANKVGSNRILGIIRDSMASIVSLLIIGSIAILLSNFPYTPVANFLAPANDLFNTIYACTTGMMGLVVAGSVAYYASVEYRTSPLISVLTSLATFLITQTKMVEGWPTINIDGLGASGLLTAMLVGIITVLILYFFEKKNIGIKMPDGVPPAVADSFSALLPSLVVLVLFTFLIRILGFDINAAIGTIMTPLSSMLDTLPGYVIYHMLCGLVFFCGINSAVVIGVVAPFIMQNSIANDAATAAGTAVQHIVTNSVDTMVWAGGTGATIGLVLLMSFIARSKYFKTLGRMSIGPGIFNINEPVIFGTPIAFNPIFLIPFILTPGIIAGGTYFLMQQGIIGMPILGNVPWTLPPVIVTFVMSGGAISTTIWGILVVIITVVIYYPFFKIADKQQYEKELKENIDTLEGTEING